MSKREGLGQRSPLVIFLAHESFERGEATVEDEFEVTKLTLGEGQSSQIVTLVRQLLLDGRVANVQVLENSSMRCVGLGQEG